MEYWKLVWVFVVAFLFGGYQSEGCWENEKAALFQIKPFFAYIEDVDTPWCWRLALTIESESESSSTKYEFYRSVDKGFGETVYRWTKEEEEANIWRKNTEGNRLGKLIWGRRAYTRPNNWQPKSFNPKAQKAQSLILQLGVETLALFACAAAPTQAIGCALISADRISLHRRNQRALDHRPPAKGK
ncbi:hypothetical protein J1N35_010395 [Gossypium stocksii]|uniref:Uncharacterized protein n=1 Tax=Gossypium stocksii TaxID=47602 RepID=A0A9D3W0W9_9ROSI|nr:hypothetical protein J1N35_010395 [Gossypium stocksii]